MTPKAKDYAFPNLRLDDENQGNGIRKIHGGRSRRYNKDKYKPSMPKRGVKEANASFLIGNRYGNKWIISKIIIIEGPKRCY